MQRLLVTAAGLYCSVTHNSFSRSKGTTQTEDCNTVHFLQRPYDNWDTVLFDCTGQVSLCILLQQPCRKSASTYVRLLIIAEPQSFDTVMQAIDSNNPRWGINTVTLVLKRPQ